MKLLLVIINQRKKSFAVIAALVAMNVLLFSFIVFYQNSRLQDLQATWFEQRRLAKAGESRAPIAIFRDGKADLATFRERIPEKREYTRLVGELLELAENNGLSTGSITYKPSEIKNENLVTYAVTMNVAGKYAGIKSLIFDIQRLPEIITIDSLALNGEGLTEESVDMRLQLTVYLKTEGA